MQIFCHLIQFLKSNHFTKVHVVFLAFHFLAGSCGIGNTASTCPYLLFNGFKYKCCLKDYKFWNKDASHTQKFQRWTSNFTNGHTFSGWPIYGNNLPFSIWVMALNNCQKYILSKFQTGSSSVLICLIHLFSRPNLLCPPKPSNSYLIPRDKSTYLKTFPDILHLQERDWWPTKNIMQQQRSIKPSYNETHFWQFIAFLIHWMTWINANNSTNLHEGQNWKVLQPYCCC